MVCLVRPYRKPTQVGECKRTQARERNLSKELGTLAHYALGGASGKNSAGK